MEKIYKQEDKTDHTMSFIINGYNLDEYVGFKYQYIQYSYILFILLSYRTIQL